VALLCGARSLYATTLWAKGRRLDAPRVLEALGLPLRRRPCVATLQRVFKVLDVTGFEAFSGLWLTQTGVAPTNAIAIDGKTLRGIQREVLPGVHLVAA
jgi:hypothetical protein